MDDDLEQRITTIREGFAFAELDDRAVRALAEASAQRTYPAGQMVFEKGTTAEAMFVVVSGSVLIVDTVRGRETELAIIHAGDFFGELAYALDIPRTRAARANQDAVLVEVPSEAIRGLMATHPTLASRLMEEFETRLPTREHAVE